MLKKFAPIFILCLLAVPLLSQWHMAEHGFDTHEHNGKICDIYLQGKYQQHADDIVPAALAESFTYITISYIIIEQPHTVSVSRNAALARAPPYFS